MRSVGVRCGLLICIERRVGEFYEVYRKQAVRIVLQFFMAFNNDREDRTLRDRPTFRESVLKGAVSNGRMVDDPRSRDRKSISGVI